MLPSPRTTRLLIAALLGVCVACGEAESPPSASGGFDGQLGRTGQFESSDPNVPLFGVFELGLGARSAGARPYVDGPEVSARFEGVSGLAQGTHVDVHGFWDGGNVWRIRFAPTLEGDWIFATSSEDQGLGGASGRIRAFAPDPSDPERGPMRRGFLERDGYGWKLSDGAPFLPAAEVQWAFAEQFSLDEVRSWISALQELGVNGLQGSVWRVSSERGELQPFADRDPKTGELDLAYFARLDEIVRHANANGVIPGLAIGGFPEKTPWYAMFGTQERHDRWFRYVVSRYAAFNVRWILFGEVDAASPHWGATWQETVSHYARIVKDEDPWDHPLGSHHRQVDSSSASNPDIDYIAVQVSDDRADWIEYRRWGKPIWATVERSESSSDPNALRKELIGTHERFVGAMVFPTISGMMSAPIADPRFPPAGATEQGVELNRYLVEHDVALRRLGEFRRFYQDLDRRRFEPAFELCSRGVCGRFGESLALVLEGGGSVSVDLRDMPGRFQVRALQISTGDVRTLRRVEGGDVRTLDTGSDQDTALVVLRES